MSKLAVNQILKGKRHLDNASVREINERRLFELLLIKNNNYVLADGDKLDNDLIRYVNREIEILGKILD